MITDRVAERLIDALERDDTATPTPDRAPLVADERRQQLLIGAWISDEVAVINEELLHDGLRPLDQPTEQLLRSSVVAELTGAGPLEKFLSDTGVEEIDVNSAESTWVTYTDGRKVDVGRLWALSTELTAFQQLSLIPL